MPQLEPDVATAFSRCALDAYLEQILILTAPPVKAYLPSAECVSPRAPVGVTSLFAGSTGPDRR